MYVEAPYIDPMTTARRLRPAELKTERLELRVAPSARRVIEQASAVSGLAAGDLAVEGAMRVLEDHERMRLRDADREVFLAAVARPPKPKARLVAALRAHGKLAR
jgi:uncharacterized protein (DUF1778 family)